MLPDVPVPAETYSRPSFFALASAKKSLNERTPSEGCTRMTVGAPPMKAICVKSRTESKPAFLLIAGATTCDDIPICISV